jgi:hypothetical protein
LRRSLRRPHSMSVKRLLAASNSATRCRSASRSAVIIRVASTKASWSRRKVPNSVRTRSWDARSEVISRHNASLRFSLSHSCSRSSASSMMHNHYQRAVKVKEQGTNHGETPCEKGGKPPRWVRGCSALAPHSVVTRLHWYHHARARARSWRELVLKRLVVSRKTKCPMRRRPDSACDAWPC